MKVVCISDTHGLHERVDVPDGDLLIHAGDITNLGEIERVRSFDDWLATLPHPNKVVIAGNHDSCFERTPEVAAALITHAHYLVDSAVEILGRKIYGSPWQPWFMDWAFNLPRGEPIRRKWNQIPADTDILVTHGPPATRGGNTAYGDDAGCADLKEAVERVQPALHVFGHIHEGYGIYPQPDTTYVNASICTIGYEPVNPPVVIEL
jgi:Icc-related predicted phosphoesterase